MKRASLVIYLGILLVSLGLAYLTWVEEPKKPGGSVPVVAMSGRNAIQVICHEDGRPFVTTTPPA